ncbi:hypothetical protein LJR230_000690 [Trinickia sp. LjRoot230]
MSRSLNIFVSLFLLVLPTLCAATGLPSIRWSAPETVVSPSSFTGVHGLAVDKAGRLLAGSVLGNAIWQVDRRTGAAKVFIGGPQGQADDIAVGPNGELAWTNFLMGIVRYRASDSAPIRAIATDLPGINSIGFDRNTGKLYVSQVFVADALWEIDVSGINPPRLIAKDLGGLEGFEVGPDGMIYGPLMFKGRVVKIDPANGAVSLINDTFKLPLGANLDGKGNLWVVDAATGELDKVDLATGSKTVFRTLKPSLDNLAIAPEGTIYVSNMADNSVEAIDPATGADTVLTHGAVAAPSGIKVSNGTMWLADVFAYRNVDLATGKVTDVARMFADGSTLQEPLGLGLSDSLVALSSWLTGTVQLLDRRTNKTLATTDGWQAPYDALPLADGTVLVAEYATGNITRLSGADFATRTVVASGLTGPVQMTSVRDGAIYVTEAGGNVVSVRLVDGRKRVVASGLSMPEGVARTPWGTLVIAEAGAARLTELDPVSGLRRTVAAQLPIGLEASPGSPQPYVPTSVAVDADGTVYFPANRNNGIYRVRPKWLGGYGGTQSSELVQPF